MKDLEWPLVFWFAQLIHEPVIEGDEESIEADGEFSEYSDDVNADAELATA